MPADLVIDVSDAHLQMREEELRQAQRVERVKINKDLLEIVGALEKLEDKAE